MSRQYISLKQDDPSGGCRSKKVEEVKTSKWGEVAWYFEDTREQYRLSGSITIVGHDHPDQNLVKVRALSENLAISQTQIANRI